MSAPHTVSMTFLTRTFATFFSRTEPASNKANPTCINSIIMAEMTNLLARMRKMLLYQHEFMESRDSPNS